jgi:Na+/H+-dicarboxylate symporter
MLRRNFKNLTANLIFLISELLSIWILSGIISIVNSYIGETETTEYNLPVTNNMFDNVSTILYLTQIIIIIIIAILIAYSGFRTGLNYSKIE